MKYLSFNQRFKIAKKFVFSQILSCFHLKKLQLTYKTEVDFSLFPLNNICTFQYCPNLLLTCIFWWSQIINTNCIFLRHNQLLQFILQSLQTTYNTSFAASIDHLIAFHNPQLIIPSQKIRLYLLMINLPVILQLRNLHTINATPILFHTEMIKSISLISLGQHLLHCKHIPTSCSQNFFTKKLQLFMSWSIFLFVSSLKINETIHSIRIKQWVQQKQNITHRYSVTV